MSLDLTALTIAPDGLRQVVDALNCPVTVLDRAGQILLANAAFCSLAAQADDQVIGKPVSALFAPATARALVEQGASVLSSGTPSTTAEQCELSSGTSLAAQVTRVPLRGADGTMAHVLCIWLRQRANASMPAPPNQPDTRVAALGQLAGLLAHQIRNPLGAISNALALVRRQLPESSADITKEALSIAQEEVWVANRAISDLLEYSRIGPPSRTRTTARRVIDLALQSESPPDQPAPVRLEGDHELFVDERQVADAISKVVRHTRDASGRRGAVTFSSHGTPTGVEIVIELPSTGPAAARPAAAPRGAAARGKPANQAPAVALGLTTAHALIANQGGRMEGGASDAAPLRFRLLFSTDAA